MKRFLILVAVAVAVLLVYGYGMLNEFFWSSREIQRFFRNKSIALVFDTLTIEGRQILVAQTGNESRPALFFIHGAPGSWTDYIRYFGDSSLVARARLIAYDRPGFGQSGAGQPITSIEQQARIARRVMDTLCPDQPVVLVGHSYGGPIAACVAMDPPANVRALVLLAPAIDPDQEKEFFFNRLLQWKFLQNLLPPILYSAYQEKITHADELRKIASGWSRVRVPVFYAHGTRDRIVPVGNINFARAQIQAPLHATEIHGANHLIIWNRRALVLSLLHQALDN